MGFFAQGNQIAGNLHAIHSHGTFTGALHMNGIFRTAETAKDSVFRQFVGDAGLYQQAVIIRVNTQNSLGNAQESPAGGAGEPGILGMTGIAGGTASILLS